MLIVLLVEFEFSEPLALRVGGTSEPNDVSLDLINMHGFSTERTVRFALDVRDLRTVGELLAADHAEEPLFPGPGMPISVYHFGIAAGAGDVRLFLFMRCFH